MKLFLGKNVVMHNNNPDMKFFEGKRTQNDNNNDANDSMKRDLTSELFRVLWQSMRMHQEQKHRQRITKYEFWSLFFLIFPDIMEGVKERVITMMIITKG
jgi:hypothetical protein